MLFTPPPEEIASAVAKAKGASEDAQVQDNHLFHLLFNRRDGVYRDVSGLKPLWLPNGDRRTRRLRRRDWIERYFRIRTENGIIAPLVLNHAQRQLEATILRMERAGIPVRVQVLKARKEGVSTYIGALAMERGLRDEYFRSLIVAHKQDSSKILLEMVNIARTRMPKRTGVSWDFKMRSQAKKSLEWAAPLHAEMTITSAEVDNPARGATPSLIHLSESAYYPKAAEKAASILSSLPALPGTYAFDESTANGAQGKFHDDFWKAWKERDTPIGQRENPWVALFFPWWGHWSYRYSQSYGAGRQVDEKVYREVVNARDSEEDWLLRQKYIRRWRPDDEWEEVEIKESEELKIGRGGKILGYWRNAQPGRKKWRRKNVGWQKVNVDQLVWRRMKLRDKEFSGDVDRFNQEFPSRPEVAFASSGSPIFDVAEIARRIESAESAGKPVFRGRLAAPGFVVQTAQQATEIESDA